MSRAAALLLAAAALGLVAIVDYATGTELRVYQFYFLPLSLAAWTVAHRRSAVLAGIACALAWGISNRAAGLHFSSAAMWVANLVAQATAFCLVAILISSLRTALTREQALSRTDALTGLLNARAFHEEGQRLLALARRYGHGLTIAYVDLDGFKAVNDSLGHARGDELLRDVSGALVTGLRETDVVARVGGDEFVILLTETNADGARTTLERLSRNLATAAHRTSERVTASIGAIACERGPSESLTELVRRADGVMYDAKQGGKDRVLLREIAPSAPPPPPPTP